MLTDLLAPDLKLIICGTAAGEQSAARQVYYAHPGNRFWRTLAAVGLTPRQLRPEEYHDLLGYGIGLTDIVKGQAGMDRDIKFHGATADTLRSIVAQLRPRCLCFNGLKAARLFFTSRDVTYGLQTALHGRTSIFVAPSTSGAAGASWDLSLWQALADHV